MPERQPSSLPDTRPASDPGADPVAFEQRLLGSADTLRSPCGEGDLVWRRWGDSGAVPLVLLHGGFGSWRHFALNIEALSVEHCVLAADLPGLGDSADLAADYTAANVAAAISAGLDHVLPPDTEFHLCGFSFGGIIGGLVAALQGERIASFTAVAPGGLGLPKGEPVNLMSPRAGMDRAALEAVHTHNLRQLMLHQPERVDALAVHLQFETVKRARARSGNIPFSNVLAEALLNVPASVTVNAIWGGADVLVGTHLASRRGFFTGLPNPGSFRVIEGAGHWVMYERPEAFNRTLSDLLKSAR